MGLGSVPRSEKGNETHLCDLSSGRRKCELSSGEWLSQPGQSASVYFPHTTGVGVY